MKNLTLFLMGVFISLTSFAQVDENWETYMAKVENKPASVLVDLALHLRPPDKLLPYLVITGPKSKNCGSNGIPSKDEIPQLEEILTATNAFITGVTPKVLAGTLTYNCERVNYYYVRDTAGLGVALTRMYKHSFGDRPFVFKIKIDPEWSTYRDFLYPSEENFTWIENNNIITKLIAQGDNLSKARDINFVLLFKTEGSRSSFIDFVHKSGYRIDELNYIKKSDYSYRLKISRFEAVKPDIIADITTEIKKEAKKYDALYEGWSCEAVK